jgi:glycine cleavage system H lipoate-binding protein
MANEVRDGLKYTKTHEWVKLSGTKVIVGIIMVLAVVSPNTLEDVLNALISRERR